MSAFSQSNMPPRKREFVPLRRQGSSPDKKTGLLPSQERNSADRFQRAPPAVRNLDWSAACAIDNDVDEFALGGRVIATVAEDGDPIADAGAAERGNSQAHFDVIGKFQRCEIGAAGLDDKADRVT